MVTRIGLDLGYADITLSDTTGSVYREPSVALTEKNTRSILAIGNAAVNTSGGEDAVLVRPFRNGMLYSSDLTRGVIQEVVKALGLSDGDRIRCAVGVPDDFVSKQEHELFAMLSEAGVEASFAVKRSVAALIGAGYSPAISAVSVNIGASATEIAVMDGGRILYSASAAIGGEDFDKAVRAYIAEQGDVSISLQVARAIKERIGAVWEGFPSEEIEIEGTISLTGNTVKTRLCTEDILGVFEQPLQQLLRAVAEAVKQIPVERVEAIFANGVILSGGGAELYGMDQMISHVLGLRVVTAAAPADCVAKGLSRIHSFLPARLRGGRNVTAQLAKYYEEFQKAKHAG